MSLAKFTWTDRVRPFIELGIGDTRAETTGRWDSSHWDQPDAVWAGTDPIWFDITCDAFTARFEYGRRATTDRFVAGVATVVVNNETGWADPNHLDPPNTLTVRPGRPIRIGVDHVVYGRRVLFRGFIDAMTPTYQPVGVDSVELECIDALGEVNRAKLVPLDAEVGAGEHASDRAIRILDAIGWSTTARDVWPSSEPLVGTTLGGQVADMLGQTADSAGGAVFGDMAGRVAFRPRDWQTYIPGTPIDGTIGNVEQGHTIPGTPEMPGYLNGAVGWVSTPDAADLSIAGDTRWTARVRRDTVAPPAATTFRMIAIQNGSQAGWQWLERNDPTLASQIRVDSKIAAAQTARAYWSAAQTAIASPLDATAHVGVELIATPTTAGPGGGTWYGLVSSDGTTWTRYGTPTLENRPYIPHDPDQGLLVGGNSVNTRWPGRIYWAQVEAINRAQLVFPGEAGNYLTTPHAANQNVAGDIELVARVSRPDWVNPTYSMAILVKNGGFYFVLGSNSVGLWSSGVFPYSTALGFAPGAIGWVKATRVAATGLTSFYSAPDSPTEPTVWTARGTAASPAGPLATATQPLTMGAYAGSGSPLTGRILRAIMRDGIGGTTVFDISENNAGTALPAATVFTATSGHTVTIAQSCQLVFPGVVGNHLSVPSTAALNIVGDIEIVARCQVPGTGLASPVAAVGKGAPGSYAYAMGWMQDGRFLFLQAPTSAPGSAAFATLARPGAITAGSMIWMKVTRVKATGVVTFYWAADAPNEPTSWTTAGTSTPPAMVNVDAAVSTESLRVGQLAPLNNGGTAYAYSGRIARAIVRNGIAGTAVLDVWEANTTTPGQTSFTAGVGGAVSVVQTSGNTIVQPRQPIVRPQANAVVWRFDANEYPGTGTTYTDPRGRVWTLSAAGAIVPKVPAVPDVVVPADVCPVQWDRPFNRADITTRAIFGRDLETAVVVDDADGMAQYGIEPFERTDLLTQHDASLTMLANRVLRTRSASTAPRVRAVTLDARTSEAAADLMSTVDVYDPSRYRCRLLEPRGLIFDEEYFATGVAHEMTPSQWSLALNLDVSSPFQAIGGRWDGAYWDLALWTATAP